MYRSKHKKTPLRFIRGGVLYESVRYSQGFGEFLEIGTEPLADLRMPEGDLAGRLENAQDVYKRQP